jgi:hypothetical protein
MKNVVVNAEYERELFKAITGELPMDLLLATRAARQYLFYYINKDPNLRLVSHNDLSSESIDYLLSKGVILPQFVKNVEGSNWYGLLNDLELERKLNSKIYSYELLKSLGLLPDNFFLVNSVSEIEEVLSKTSIKKWVLKSPFLCGGLGFKFIECSDDLPKILNSTYILEPFLERIIDMAVHFEPKTGESFPYISLIKQNGTYLGGKIYSNNDLMYSELKQYGLYEAFNQNIVTANLIINELKKFKLQQPLTVDSFLYKEGDKVMPYPMCEINYRISMGTLNAGLKSFIPEGGVGLLLSLKPKPGINWRTILPYSPVEKTGVLSLNDGNVYETAVLISAENLKVLDRYKRIVLPYE